MNFVNIRINKDQIKQYHLSERELTETELKKVPDKYWVNWFELDDFRGRIGEKDYFEENLRQLMREQVKPKKEYGKKE